jgi:hypothetical protein
MKTDSRTTATILDLDAQTVTTINNTAKTYTVHNFSDLGGPGVDAKIDVKETGQKKMLNGFMANEVIMTMEVDSPQTRQLGPMQMEWTCGCRPMSPAAVR